MRPHLATPDRPSPSVAPSAQPARPRSSSACILIVDDDYTVCASLAEVLRSEGYTVIAADSGERALELAATGMDLVLLDLSMPGKNGWVTFEQLREEHPLLPVIIITACPNQLFTALGAGVNALMEKPLDIRELLATVQRQLDEPRANQLRRLAGQKAPFTYLPSAGCLDRLTRPEPGATEV